MTRRLGFTVFAIAIAMIGASLAMSVPVDAQSGAAPSDWAYPDDHVDQRAPVNGCGSQGEDGVDVPDQIGSTSFTPACNWHDRCYGTKGLSRSYCDRGMLAKNLDACGDGTTCRGVAKLYYLGVAAFGGDPYRAGQQLACDRDPTRDGRVHGDPHLVTLDGTSYAFMAAGEFSLLRDTDGEDLIQGRFYPQSDTFTVVTGVAVKLGDREAVVQIDPDTSEVTAYLDGKPITRNMAAFDEGLIEMGTALEGVRQVVTIRGWDGLRVEAVIYDDRMDLGVNLPEWGWGEVSGLLGDADGDRTNDLVDTNGDELQFTSLWTAVYDDDFISEWRLAADDSMFVLDDSPFDYHGKDIHRYPSEVMTLEAFGQAELEASEQRCRAAGLTGDELISCTFDVLVSGDESYADTAARSANRARDVAHPHQLTGGDRDNAQFIERPPLVEAVEQGDIDEVERLLDAGEDVDVGRDSDGLTPLLTALIMNRTEITELLLEHGANPNAFDDRQMAPLQIAILVGGNTDVVEWLLDAGADVNTGSDQGGSFYSPLSAAAASGNLEVLDLLLDAGADPNGIRVPGRDADLLSPLYAAAAQGGTEVAERLLDAGADPNGWWPEAEFGPLYGAALSSNTELVQLLLDAGADPDSAMIEGVDPSLLIHDEEILDMLGFSTP